LEKASANIGIIILAAGSSSRMGQSKQLLDVNGKTLLRLSIDTAAKSSARKTVVVLGANEKAHSKIVSGSSAEAVINPFWENGMGSSLKTGLNFLLKKCPLAEAVIILVCDQPLLTGEHLTNLIDTHYLSQKPIVASRYADTIGVPVLFAKKYFEKLQSLKDNEGAKKIIKENPADIAIVEFPQGEIDLDTTEEYDRFIRSQKQEKLK